MPSRWAKAAIPALAAVALIAACSPIRATRGHIVEDEKVAQLEVGISTRDDVLDILGSPTTVGTFDDSNWYYIGQRTERTAFLAPEIVERRVLLVSFDEAGVIQRLEERGLEDAENVELVERETPTLGRRITFLEQMFGNLGRFNPDN